MADEHGVVALGGQGAVGFVGDGDIVQEDAGFEFEGGDDGDGLVGDELDEGVLGLVAGGYTSWRVVLLAVASGGGDEMYAHCTWCHWRWTVHRYAHCSPC